MSFRLSEAFEELKALHKMIGEKGASLLIDNSIVHAVFLNLALIEFRAKSNGVPRSLRAKQFEFEVHAYWLTRLIGVPEAKTQDLESIRENYFCTDCVCLPYYHQEMLGLIGLFGEQAATKMIDDRLIDAVLMNSSRQQFRMAHRSLDERAEELRLHISWAEDMIERRAAVELPHLDVEGSSLSSAAAVAASLDLST